MIPTSPADPTPPAAPRLCECGHDESEVGWKICDVHGRVAFPLLYATREEADRARQAWASGHYYHVRPVRVTTEVLGAPPEPWCTIVNSTGTHHV